MPPPIPIFCGNCETAVSADVVAGHLGIADSPVWLKCPACGDGSVMTVARVVYPPMPTGGHVKDLPADVERAWREARTAHSVAAYTASEIMCRKILMHVAVGVSASKPGKRFVEYVDALESTGHIPPHLKPVVDRVRGRGNAANHELPASTEQDSLMTLKITEFLLRGTYELPNL